MENKHKRIHTYSEEYQMHCIGGVIVNSEDEEDVLAEWDGVRWRPWRLVINGRVIPNIFK